MRLSTGSNVTGNKLLTCPAGMKWIVYGIRILLKTGASAGTRRVQVQFAADTTVDPVQEVIADTGAQTTESVNFGATGGLSSSSSVGGGSGATAFSAVLATPWNAPLRMGQNAGQILILPTLIAGDKYNYYLLVDEIPDESP